MSGIIAQNTLDNSGLVKAPAGGGAWNFISKQTASSSGTLDFTSGIDSTYKEYVFTFKNIHPATDNTPLTFQANTAGGSGYNETMTTSYFRAYNTEAGSSGFGYDGNRDLSESTSFQQVISDIGNENDECGSGYLHLFNPSSTTFVKHFICTTTTTTTSAVTQYIAGYFNTTSAIDEIQFKMASGDIDSGDICLYGITT